MEPASEPQKNYQIFYLDAVTNKRFGLYRYHEQFQVLELAIAKTDSLNHVVEIFNAPIARQKVELYESLRLGKTDIHGTALRPFEVQAVRTLDDAHTAIVNTLPKNDPSVVCILIAFYGLDLQCVFEKNGFFVDDGFPVCWLDGQLLFKKLCPEIEGYRYRNTDYRKGLQQLQPKSAAVGRAQGTGWNSETDERAYYRMMEYDPFSYGNMCEHHKLKVSGLSSRLRVFIAMFVQEILGDKRADIPTLARFMKIQHRTNTKIADVVIPGLTGEHLSALVYSVNKHYVRCTEMHTQTVNERTIKFGDLLLLAGFKLKMQRMKSATWKAYLSEIEAMLRVDAGVYSDDVILRVLEYVTGVSAGRLVLHGYYPAIEAPERAYYPLRLMEHVAQDLRAKYPFLKTLNDLRLYIHSVSGNPDKSIRLKQKLSASLRNTTTPEHGDAADQLFNLIDEKSKEIGF